MNTDITVFVDDDEVDREIFIEYAKEVNTNINSITARDGEEALKYLRNENNLIPDYIF